MLQRVHPSILWVVGFRKLTLGRTAISDNGLAGAQLFNLIFGGALNPIDPLVRAFTTAYSLKVMAHTFKEVRNKNK